MEHSKSDELPRTIWMMWLQGLENAPRVVRECYTSWRTLNPDWNFVFIDQENMHEFVDMTSLLAKQPLMERQAVADIFRMNLLERYGGVWADATCFCRVPLSEWIDKVAPAGFFLFSYPDNRQSLVHIWFIAATHDNYMIKVWTEAIERLVLENPNLGRRPKTARWFKLLSRNTFTTRYYFSFPIRRIFRFYPYYWTMYLFAEVIRRDKRAKEIWEEMPKIRRPNPPGFDNIGILSPLTKELKEEIDSKKSPLFKLSWKYNEEDFKEGCILDYIFSLNC